MTASGLVPLGPGNLDRCSLAIAEPTSRPAEEPRPITRLIPADCLVAYTAKPYPLLAPSSSAPAGSQPANGTNVSSIATIVSFLNASGLIPDEGQVFADIAAALPLLGQFDHAIVLLDISSKPIENRDGDDGSDISVSLRLNQLQSAVIFRTDGRHRVVLELLNRVVGRYTNQDVAKLTTEQTSGFSYQRLVDSRLIGWAVWEWGRIDDCFVVCFGEGSFARVAETFARKHPSLANDAWFKSASKQIHGDSAIAQWFISFSGLKDRLGAATQERVAKVTQALEAQDINKDLWTIGRDGRAMTWFRCYQQGNKDVVKSYSDPSRYPPSLRGIIPGQAEHLAIIQAPTPWLIDNLPRAWLAAQSEGKVEFWHRVWEQVERDAGIDINGNLISHLGQNVVIFDYPPHPLRVPFALTIAIEINDRKAVTDATNALLEAWGRYLDERADRLKTTLVRMKVKKADDGVWYLQAGILGPALKVTDQFLVISWSPEALRDALRFVEGSEGRSREP